MTALLRLIAVVSFGIGLAIAVGWVPPGYRHQPHEVREIVVGICFLWSLVLALEADVLDLQRNLKSHKETK